MLDKTVIVMATLCLCPLVFCGCAKDENRSSEQKSVSEPKQAGESKQQTRAIPLVHGSVNPDDAGKDAVKGLAEVIKLQKLPEYPDVTIGKAFDGYTHFKSKEWHESRSANNTYYIDFIGWQPAKSFDLARINANISAIGYEVKFVITPGNDMFIGLVSRLEAKSDGKVQAYPLENRKEVLDRIYTNKEINF